MASGLSVNNNSVWGSKVEKAEEPVVSFLDIMSEELAEQLDETKLIESTPPLFDESLAAYGLDPSLSNASDLEIARALQEKFDQEQAAILKAEEERKDPSKVEVGFRHFSEKPHLSWSDLDMPKAALEGCGINDDNEFESQSDKEEEEFAQNFFSDSLPKSEFPPCGFVRGADGHLITKHDKEMEEIHNIDKVLELPLHIPTGDVVGEKISNKVYNSLRNYGNTDVKRSVRVQDKEEKATSEQSINAITRMIIYKWINMGTLFDSVEGIIATGKESVVLHAVTHEDPALEVSEQHYAIKVFKLTLSEFKNRSEYVYDDYRFKNPRGILRVWAEKEFMNLHRIFRAGIRCPVPIRLKKHVMLMSLIGSNGTAATKLKDIIWSDEESKTEAFQEVRQIMNCMYTECRLVHGDLSEFNLLYHDGHVYVIDVSQSMDSSHPRSLFFLLRDIENVLDFFLRIGTDNLPSATELFNEITGLSMDQKENLLVQVENFEKDNRNAQLREDKARPGDMECRLYYSEVAATKNDPAALYN